LYLTTFLREEGRLAARVGDKAGSGRAYRQYLALRAGADPVFRASSDSVRAALVALEGGAENRP
jgi:hypothetical protein